MYYQPGTGRAQRLPAIKMNASRHFVERQRKAAEVLSHAQAILTEREAAV